MQILDDMDNEMKDMKQYPTPNFSAQDAWKNMQKILDEEMPTNEKRKKRFAFFWLMGLMLLGGGIYVLYRSNDVSKINNSIAKIDDSKPDKSSTNNSKSTIDNANIKNDNTIVNSEQKNVVTIQDNNINSVAFKSTELASNAGKNNRLIITRTKIKQIRIGSEKEIKNQNNEDEFYTQSTPQINILKKMAAKQNVTTNTDISSKINNMRSSSAFVAASNIEPDKKQQTNIVENITKATASNQVIKVPQPKLIKSIHYGLQWNVLLPQSNSYLDYNAKSQPLSVIIPEFWVSKDLSRKSEIALQVNPYSQYTLRSNNLLASKDYVVSVSQGSNQNPATTTYVQTRSLLKAMGLELTAKYTYKLSDKFSIAIGLGNTWLNAAVVNDKVVSQEGKLSHDSIYGIAKGFNDWNYLKSSIIVGRFEMLYQFKKLQAGLAFVKPLGNIYSFSNSNSNPVNARLVLRWRIK